MGFLIIIALWTALRLIFKNIFWEKLWLIITILVISIIFAIKSTYVECSDWRQSQSIWTQGACSHHWGVKTKVNGLWIGVLLFSFFTFIWYYIVLWYRDKKWLTSEKNNETNRSVKTINDHSQIKIIREAIKQWKEISFHYKKSDWTESDRVIYPMMINVYKWTTCIRGFYKKSDKNRNFAIHRMSNIKIIS